jgi:5,10-methylenetetrahydromethanopterin reductase
LESALLLGQTGDVRRFGESARQVETLGYSAAWVPDQGFHRDPFIALASAAQHTSLLQLGLGVANAYTRHPAMLARAAGTLAELSGGRFILGLGSGERPLRDRVGSRRTPFLPTIKPTFEAIRALLCGQSVTVKNDLFEMHNAKLDFAVHHRIPLYLATRDHMALRLAGEIADGVILGDFCEPATVRQLVSLVHDGARAAGRMPAAVHIVSWVITIVTGDREMVIHRLRPMLAGMLATMVPDGLRALGVDTATAQALRTTARTDMTALERLIPDDLVDAAAIIGDAAYCRRRVQSLRDAGATQLAVRMPMDLAYELDYKANMRAFAEHVLPHLA